MIGSDQGRLELVLRPDPLGSAKDCEIFFVSGDYTFPSVGWTDLSDVTDGWRDELSNLDRHGACELWFLDGPYQVNITVDDGLFEFEFAVRTTKGTSVQNILKFTRENSIENILQSIAAWDLRARH